MAEMCTKCESSHIRYEQLWTWPKCFRFFRSGAIAPHLHYFTFLVILRHFTWREMADVLWCIWLKISNNGICALTVLGDPVYYAHMSFFEWGYETGLNDNLPLISPVIRDFENSPVNWMIFYDIFSHSTTLYIRRMPDVLKSILYRQMNVSRNGLKWLII